MEEDSQEDAIPPCLGLLLPAPGSLQEGGSAGPPPQPPGLLSWTGARAVLRFLRIPKVVSEVRVLGSTQAALVPCSATTRFLPADGPSSSRERLLDPLEDSWLERREKSLDRRRRVERVPSDSTPSGFGRGGSAVSALAGGAAYREVRDAKEGAVSGDVW